jgi:hypothetical protein
MDIDPDGFRKSQQTRFGLVHGLFPEYLADGPQAIAQILASGGWRTVHPKQIGQMLTPLGHARHRQIGQQRNRLGRSQLYGLILPRQLYRP